VFKKDLYMKVVFTIIALSLCVIAIRNTELIKKAEANSGQNIHITNAEEIGRAIATNLSLETLNVGFDDKHTFRYGSEHTEALIIVDGPSGASGPFGSSN